MCFEECIYYSGKVADLVQVGAMHNFWRAVVLEHRTAAQITVRQKIVNIFTMLIVRVNIPRWTNCHKKLCFKSCLVCTRASSPATFAIQVRWGSVCVRERRRDWFFILNGFVQRGSLSQRCKLSRRQAASYRRRFKIIKVSPKRACDVHNLCGRAAQRVRHNKIYKTVCV